MGERAPCDTDNLNLPRLELCFLVCSLKAGLAFICVITPCRQIFAISFQVHNCCRVTGRGKRRRSRVAFSAKPYNIHPDNMRDSIETSCECTHSENTLGHTTQHEHISKRRIFKRLRVGPSEECPLPAILQACQIITHRPTAGSV